MYLLLSALATVTVAHGGALARGVALGGTLLVVGALVGARHRQAVGEAVRSPVGLAAAGLAVWAVVRGVAAGSARDGAAVAGALALVVLAFALAAALDRVERERVLLGTVGVGVIVALTCWVGITVRYEPWALLDPQVWRAASAITYANAAAAFLVAVVLVALGMAVDRPSPVLAVATMLMLVGAALTLSRGGVLAFVAGLGAMAAALGARRVIGALAAPALGALIAVLGAVPSLPRSADVRPVPAVVALLLAVALTTATSRIRVTHRASPRIATARWGLAFGGLVLAAVAASALGGGALSDRLAFGSPERVARTEAAWELFVEHPVAGIGPGPVWLTWRDASGATQGGWHVHDEYLEILVQLGVVGGLLLVALLFASIRAVWGGRIGVLTPGAWAGIAGALVALAVHSAVDFLWHLPAITILGAMLVGLAASRHEGATTWETG